MTKRDLSSFKATLTSGSHGRRFTDEEEGIIVSMMSNAKTNGKTISVAEIKNALKDHNHEQNQESRKRAAVVNAIERLAKTGKVDKAVLSKESSNREPYTEQEDNVLCEVLMEAQTKGEQVSIPDLHKALRESGVSPKERSLPSVRAHITNLLNKSSSESESESESVEDFSDEDAEDIA